MWLVRRRLKQRPLPKPHWKYIQKQSVHASDKVKATIRKFILAVNYTIAVVICLALLTQPQVPIIERALYGFSTILIGIGIRRMVKTLMPLDEDQIYKNND